MVFDTRLLVKVSKQIVRELRPEDRLTCSSGAVNLQVCRHNAAAAAIAVTSCLGNNSTNREKVYMITIMYLNPISEGKGPIVSIRSIAFNVESTNLEARIIFFCRASIF